MGKKKPDPLLEAYRHGAVAVCRVKDGRPTIVGMGILLAPQVVVTCAHVVNAALPSRTRYAEDPPSGKVRLVNPFWDGEEAPTKTGGNGRTPPRHYGTVIPELWCPPSSLDAHVSPFVDLAVLALDDSVTGVTPARLLDTDFNGERPMKARAFGYPSTKKPDGTFVLSQNGRTAFMRTGSRVGRNRVEVMRVDQELFICPGFSGAHAFWSEEKQRRSYGVLGMCESIDAFDNNAGFLVPTSVIAILCRELLNEQIRTISQESSSLLNRFKRFVDRSIEKLLGES